MTSLESGNSECTAVATEDNPNMAGPTERPSSRAAESHRSMTSIDQAVEDKKNQLPPWPSPVPTPHKDFVHSNPPEPPKYRKFTVFAAGSIEMGGAVNWQPLVATMLNHLPITVCNPRKGSWDQNIKQQAKDELFEQQVVWELGALEQADVICFFFDTETKSPVSLLELGVWSGSDKVVVCCGDAYWKSGNVHLTCDRYGVPRVRDLPELVTFVEDMLKEKGMKLDNKGNLIGENVHVPKAKPKKRTQLEAEIAVLEEQVEYLEAKLAAQLET
ncbi:hypothetical protein AALT_g11064 [Alternaria alternata]|nr:hypothetical protein AALT_g11064 [Alternaria alternata]